MKRTATLLTFIWLISVPAWAQLTGTYTIGGASPDYATFTAAAADLNANGVSGPVVFNVRTGTYTEQLTLGAVTGTSGTNTITFQSESATASDVMLEYAPTGSGDNWTIQLTDTDHVIVQNMTLKSSGSNTFNRRVVHLIGTLEGVSITGSVIEGYPNTFGASTNRALIYSNFNTITTALTLTGNTFTNGDYAIHLTASSGTRATGTVIANNAFGGTTLNNVDVTQHDGASITGNAFAASFTGLELESSDGGTIGQNTFAMANSTSANAIRLSDMTGAYRVERNRIHQNAGNGIQLANSSGASGNEARVANNVVTLGNGFNGTALNLAGTTNFVNVYHNTFVAETNSNGAYLVRAESAGANIVLRNNIFAHFGTGVPLSIGSVSPSVSDFNAFFAAGSVIARVNNVNYSFFSDYQAAASLDLQSQDVDPSFVDRDGADDTAGTSDDNLVPQSAFIDTEGTDLTSVVAVDFDGTARSVPVSIGAYEFTSGAAAPLSAGTYTVGGGGTYATLAAAAADLANRGVAGAVTFSIASGTYTEQVSFGPIAGASGANTVTFQAASGNAADVTWKFEPTSGANYLVELAGTSFITFRNLTFNSDPNADGGSQGRIFVLSGAVEGLTLNTVTLNGISGFGSNAVSLVYGTSTAMKNLLVTGSTFNQGFNQIDLEAPFSPQATGTQVLNSTFTDAQRTSVRLSRHDGVVITGHTVTDAATSGISINNSTTAVTVSQNTLSFTGSNAVGIELSTVAGASRVEKNRITLTSGTGIRLLSTDGSGGSEVRIANNFVSGNAGNNGERGIDLSSSDHVQIYHNSVNLRGTSASNSWGLRVSFGSNLDVRNNIFAVTTGRAIEYSSASVVSVSNYNDLFNTGANLAKVGSTDYGTLAAYQAGASLDANSVSVDPGFTSATDLHASSAFIDNEGTPLTAVPDDIDGEGRSATAPSIGADEFSAAGSTLSGTYTIGGGGDYATWAAAASALETNGISGAVTFNVATGTYAEQVSLGPVAGASAANTITFQPTSGTLGDVALQADPTSGTNYIFLVDGADFVRFNRIAFNADGSSDGGSHGRALVLQGGVNGAQVTNSSFTGVSGFGSIADKALLYAGGSTVTTDFIAQNNTFATSDAAVYLNGAASTGTQISDNTVSGADDYGIYVSQHTAVQITGNTLSGTTSQGLWVQNSGGALRVLKNTITGASGNGIRIESSDATSGSEGLIANNMVQMSSGSSTALSVSNSDYQQFIHNTLRIGSGASGGQATSLSGTQNAITLRNNLLINEMGSYAIHLFSTPTNFVADWNNLYTTGANVGRIGSTDYATLSAYQAASGTDANSVSTAVTFASATDLHLSGASQTDVTLAAIALSTVTDDRDGDARFALFSAMGADEASSSLASSQAVSSDGVKDFGASYAIDVNFQNVSGSGNVAGVLLRDGPANVSGITENNVAGYRWVLESDGTLAFGATTEIRFDLDEVADNGVTDPNDVMVYKRDTPGSGAFSALTTTYAAGTNEIVATGFTSFSEFVFASNTNALPVELTAFDATLNGDAVALTWATASETNNAGFEVQWAMMDADAATDWTVASFVDGHGTTLEAQRYTYQLDGLEPGTYHFRLRQVDFDGTFAYSPEVELTLEIAESYWLSPAYPNPFNPQAQFEVMVRRSQPVAVRVYDVAGRQVLQLRSGILEAGTRHRFQIDGSTLASGTYLIRVTGEEFAATQRIVLLK
ncbi:MAG: hypothetical protein RhofKO_40320 [Rhodothermales bacterium]